MVSYWEMTIYYAVFILASGGAIAMINYSKAAIMNAKAQIIAAQKVNWVAPGDAEDDV